MRKMSLPMVIITLAMIVLVLVLGVVVFLKAESVITSSFRVHVKDESIQAEFVVTADWDESWSLHMATDNNTFAVKQNNMPNLEMQESYKTIPAQLKIVVTNLNKDMGISIKLTGLPYDDDESIRYRTTVTWLFQGETLADSTEIISSTHTTATKFLDAEKTIEIIVEYSLVRWNSDFSITQNLGLELESKEGV